MRPLIPLHIAAPVLIAALILSVLNVAVWQNLAASLTLGAIVGASGGQAVIGLLHRHTR